VGVGNQPDEGAFKAMTTVGSLVKPFYEGLYHNIAVEKQGSDYYVITDRFAADGDVIKVRVEQLEHGGWRATEGESYTGHYLDLTRDFLTDAEATDYLVILSDDWGVLFNEDEGIYFVDANEDEFPAAFGRLLDFLTEVSTAAVFSATMSEIRKKTVYSKVLTH
jgi:hypothetical protein